jgi:class 3 adenylate cyclase
MASTGSDDRIPRFIEAAEALRDGRFGVRVPEAGSTDQVARLGTAINDLSSALERRWREVAEVDAIAARINAGLLLDDVLEDFYREARDIFPYDRVGFSLLESGGTVVRARWARSDLGPLRLGRGYAARLEGSSLQSILETGRPRVINDLVAYLASKPSSDSTRLVVEEGVRSSLTCPLVANGVPVGFMFFSSRQPDTYRDAHVDAYRRIAGQLSVIVEKGRLISELSEQKAALEIRNRFITRVFGRYLSDAVVEQLLETPDGLRLGGERRVVTVVMTDLRGFTATSERIPPESVVALLNLHLGAMSEIVIEHGGTIDEFIGDALLALFGAPLAAEDDARRALTCAVEMQQAMEGVNARARELSLPEMGMGVGVHTGEVVVGNIGSERRAKYGVVGAAINLASRIQGFTLGGQILASEETLRAAGPDVSVGARFSIQAKGFRDPVSIVEVLGVGEAVLAPASDTLTLLESPVSIEIERLAEEEPQLRRTAGALRAVGRWEAALETAATLAPREEVLLILPGGLEVLARVLGPAGRGTGVRIRFEALPEEAARRLGMMAGRTLPPADSWDGAGQ